MYSPVLMLLSRPTERIVVVRESPSTIPPKSGVLRSVMITTRLSQEPLSGSPVSAAATWSSGNRLSGIVYPLWISMVKRPPPAVALSLPHVSVRGIPSSPGRQRLTKGAPAVLRQGLDVRLLTGDPSWNHFSLPGSKEENSGELART